MPCLLEMMSKPVNPLEVRFNKDDPEDPLRLKPLIEETTGLWLDGLEVPGDIARVLPGFPKSMPKLQTLSLGRRDTTQSEDWGIEGSWERLKDPFGSFPITLEHLFLNKIPLYKSFLNLGSLTVLQLWNCFADFSLSKFLKFLKNNPSLKAVVLFIDFPSFASLRTPDEPVIQTENQLEYLMVKSAYKEVITALISSITLKPGASLDISHQREDKEGAEDELERVLKCVYEKKPIPFESPDFAEFRSGGYVKVSGPSWHVSFEGRPGPATLPCKSSWQDTPFSWESIGEIHLHLKDMTAEFVPSFFPALKTLVIQDDLQPSLVLRLLFLLRQPCPSLKTLGFSNCHLNEEFVENLVAFASKRRKELKLSRIVIVCERPDDQYPDIVQLAPEEVGEVEICEPGTELLRGAIIKKCSDTLLY